jgi:hypothetical protein
MTRVEEKQRAEIEFCRVSRRECPNADSFRNIVNKLSNARVLLQCLSRHEDSLATEGGHGLELGAGRGWVPGLYQRLYPAVRVTAIDLRTFSIQGLPLRDKLFAVTVDDSWVWTSYET